MATLITGASTDLGKAMAREYARRGMDLVPAVLQGEGRGETSLEIEKTGGVRVLPRDTDAAEDGTPAGLAACTPLPFKIVNPAAQLNSDLMVVVLMPVLLFFTGRVLSREAN
jgi:NAD(P)-dependent dehydrogenase (short-subunit alcohol dehydrogenase family)